MRKYWCIVAVILFFISICAGGACPSPRPQHFFDGLKSLSRVVYPSSPSYAEDILEWNQDLPTAPSPCVIVFANTEEEVQTAVSWAYQHGVAISVRSGRHSYEGYSVGEGIVIDVSALNEIQVDPNTATLYTQSGAKLFSVYYAAYQHGFMFPGGTCPTVGIGGYTLGGGYGFLSRSIGLAIDSLLSMRVVLPPKQPGSIPEITTVNEQENAELFWALRGAGNGNFGVVLSFNFTLHSLPPSVTMYTIDWQASVGAFGQQILDTWQQWLDIAPANLTGQLNIYHTSVASTGLYMGPSADVPKYVAPLLQLPGASMSSLKDMNYLDAILNLAGCSSVADCQQQVNSVPSLKSPLYWKGKSLYITQPLNSEGLSRVFRYMNDNFRNCCGNNFAGLLIDPYGGVISKVDSEATAFAHRNVRFHIQMMVYWNDPVTDTKPAHEWIAAFRDALVQAQVAQGDVDASYVNYCDEDLLQWQRVYFGRHYTRLQALKAAVDPMNLFHYAQSIQPL